MAIVAHLVTITLTKETEDKVVAVIEAVVEAVVVAVGIMDHTLIAECKGTLVTDILTVMTVASTGSIVTAVYKAKADF